MELPKYIMDAAPLARCRLAEQEVELLLVSAIRNPAVFRAARESMRPDLFHRAGESPLAAVWRAVLDLVAHHGEEILSSASMAGALRGRLAQVFADKDRFTDGMVESILGPGGLLDRAFAVPPEAYDPAVAGTLLREFVTERDVFDALQSIVRNCGHDKFQVDMPEMFAEFAARLARVGGVGHAPARSLQGDWQEYERRRAAYRGRELIGLRTGLNKLDERTLGLRGLTVLGAAPNVGKTALAVDLGVRVATPGRNDAVFVFVSLEMDKWDLYDRVVCNLAGLDWKTLRLGSPSLRGRAAGPHHTRDHLEMIERADAELRSGELGQRVCVYDREVLGDVVTAGRISSLVAEAKRQAGVSWAFIVLDYLQLLPVPDDVARRGDLEADKYRVRVAQDVVAATKTAANPSGDPLLVISEARKPAGAAKGGWGRALGDLMGSARLGYAVDAALLYRVMNETEVQKYYPEAAAEGTEAFMRHKEDEGVAPIILTLAKGRDGMHRGEWPMEFLFRQSKFRELPTDDQPRADVPVMVPAPGPPPARSRRAPVDTRYHPPVRSGEST